MNAPADPLLGTMLNEKYQIVEFAGQGATGRVYKARQIFMDRMVAIKILKQKLVTDALAMGRFERELKTLGKLKHSSIVPVFDCFVHQGLPCCVMDFLSGRSIKDMLSEEGPFEAEAVIQILLQVTDALKHAHNHDVIHRDLKGANIMLEATKSGADRVFVVDFGLAKFVTDEQRLTQTGNISGSPVYMSPEQCAGADLDGRSDIYSLGVVMYEMLSGHVPFLGQTVMDTLTLQVYETPEPLSSRFPELMVPERLEQAVLKCLEKDPDERFQTMAELHNVLEHCLKLGAANAPRQKDIAPKRTKHPSQKTVSPANKKTNANQNAKAGTGFQFQHRTKLPPWIMVLAATGAILILGLSITVFFLLNKLTSSPAEPAKVMPQAASLSSKTKSVDESSPANDATIRTVKNAPVPFHSSPGISTNSESQTKARQNATTQRMFSVQKKRTNPQRTQNTITAKGKKATTRPVLAKPSGVMDTDFAVRLKNLRSH